MKQIILERNVDYASWENLIYSLVILSGLFVGSTFFSSGNTANFFSAITGFLLLCSAISLAIKKGLIQDKKLYKGYFLLGKAIYRKEILNPMSDNFTLLKKRYRQKYVRSIRELDWEYSVDSFELFFFDEDGAIRNRIIKCLTYQSCEKAKMFLIENSNLKFRSFD